MYKMGIQHGIWANRFRSFMLLFLFPVLLVLIIGIVFFLLELNQVNWNINNPYLMEDFLYNISSILIILLPILLIRCIISFLLYRRIIFKFTGAKAINRKQNPKIYNIVENLCISRGLPIPKIGIIEDNSMNAFATGWNTKKARIVFSRGLIEKLDKREIEAVAGHELTHIMNKDTLMMLIIVVYVGAISVLGQILIRVRGSKDSKGSGAIILLGLSLIVLGYLIYPLIRFALSRKREYLADAGSVELTKDKFAMISALEKISQDSQIESIKKDNVASMCIATPFNKKKNKKRSWISRITATHPPIEDRIDALKNY